MDKYWRLYYNAQFLDNYSVETTAGVLLLMLESLIRNHAHRAKSDINRWAIACALETLDDIKPLDTDIYVCEVEFRSPEQLTRDISVRNLHRYFSVPTNQLAEYYYHELLGCGESFSLLGMATGSCMGGTDVPWECGPPSEKNPGVDRNKATYVRKKTATDVISHNDCYGNVPNGVIRVIDQILKPSVKWERLLKRYVSKNIGRIKSGANDFSYTKPRHTLIHLSTGVEFPGLVQRAVKTAWITDTSGSMDLTLLAQAQAELRNILKSEGIEEGVTHIQWDSALQSFETIYSIKNSSTMKGAGGTSMKDALDYVFKLKVRHDLIVVFTDGKCRWPSTIPRGFNVIICVCSKKRLNHLAWATVVSVG